ncbi:MAG: hypothetical protein H0X13_10635 [Ramlibacter sp.]|nr:hypothetical protein [Ramlibacter sp.]
MGLLDTLIHLLSFAAPALAVAVLVVLAARLLVPRRPDSISWWVCIAINFMAGVIVLGAGLWYFGVDGKMATYAALVVAVATCQWLCGAAWKA